MYAYNIYVHTHLLFGCHRSGAAISVFVCMHACMLHACMHVCVYTYIHTYIHLYIHTHPYIHPPAFRWQRSGATASVTSNSTRHTYIYIYTHIHTYIHRWERSGATASVTSNSTRQLGTAGRERPWPQPACVLSSRWLPRCPWRWRWMSGPISSWSC